MTATQPHPSPAIVTQAAAWAALFDDPPVAADARRAFEDWCAANPLHRTTFERMNGLGARFDALDAVQARTVSQIARGRSPRRIMLGFACLLALFGTGMALDRSFGFHALWPDHATEIGEQRRLALADGSRLIADTGTRFDAYSGEGDARHIRLFEGQVMATVAHLPDSPFVVETEEGTATALGTVYSVRRYDHRSVVTVLQSRVRVCLSAGPCRTLGAGERAALTATGIEPLAPVDPETAGLWATGWIEVHDRPLPEVIAELARYRTAAVHFDARAVADLRVTGSYPLTDPEAAFRSIVSATGLAMAIDADGTIALSRAER